MAELRYRVIPWAGAWLLADMTSGHGMSTFADRGEAQRIADYLNGVE